MTHPESIESFDPREESWIRSLLQGRPFPWPHDFGAEDEARFLRITRDHGIQPLIQSRAAALPDIPRPVLASLREQAILEATWDSIRTEALGEVVQHAEREGIPLLVVKGSALAWSHYASPELRPRADQDLLLREEDLRRLEDFLSAHRWEESLSIDTEDIFSQTTWVTRRSGFRLAFDLHWRMSNLKPVARMFDLDSLLERSREVTAGGFRFRAPSSPDALLIATTHRVAHHPGADRVIWLYDIHLLFESLSQAEEDELWRRAVKAEATSILVDGLAAARRWFGTRESRLEMQPDPSEPTAVLLQGARRGVHDAMLSLRWAGGWRMRVRWLFRQFFPPPRYMMERYGAGSAIGLPLLYLRRIVIGISRLLRTPEEARRPSAGSSKEQSPPGAGRSTSGRPD